MIDIFSSARLKKHKLWGKYPSIQNENEVLQIKSAGNEIGEGTFAVQPIDKGDIVCEYKGKLLEVPKHLMKGKWPPDVDLVTTHGNFTFFFKTMDGKGWCLDAEDSEGFGLFDQVPMNFADMDGAEFVVCTRPYDYGDDIEEYEDLLTDLLDRDLDMVCTNPDVKVKVDGREVMCAGAIAQAYERMGGTAVYGGKPHPPIYQLARAWLEETMGYAPERILMIGDNLFTDVVGAQREGIDCLFIQDGLYGATAEEFRAICERHGISAQYQLPELAW